MIVANTALSARQKAAWSEMVTGTGSVNIRTSSRWQSEIWSSKQSWHLGNLDNLKWRFSTFYHWFWSKCVSSGTMMTPMGSCFLHVCFEESALTPLWDNTSYIPFDCFILVQVGRTNWSATDDVVIDIIAISNCCVISSWVLVMEFPD